MLLAACSSAGDPERSPERNVAIAADSVPPPAPAASSAVVDPAPLSGPTPSPEPLPTPSATPDPVITAEAREEDGPEQGADGAVRLVRRYYALVGRGAYAQAWRLWDDDGRASGMSAAAFADSFAKFDRYDAAVGRPGRIEAGAGQRHIEVPVALTGTLDSGAPFAMRGTVTLHRAGPIDGATAEQRAWRISATNIKPRPNGEPVAAATRASVVETQYRCNDGSRLVARFDRRADTAQVRLGGTLLGELAGQRPASGLWYRRGDVELRGKGEAAVLRQPGQKPLACVARG